MSYIGEKRRTLRFGSYTEGPPLFKRRIVPKSQTVRSPRADARRNRQRLLATALKLFTSSKDEVTLSAVAEEAGVGIGTLYRHFPTRDALVEAIYRQRGRAARRRGAGAAQGDAGGRGAGGLADPLCRAYRDQAWAQEAVRSIFEPGAEARPIRASVCGRPSRCSSTRQPRPAGCAATSIRPDVLLAVAASTWTLAGDGEWEERVRPVLRIIMDGLRYKPG